MARSGKVLVVDDNDSQRDFLIEVINRTLPMWQVVKASSVNEAIAAIRNNPDLAIAVVDLHLTRYNKNEGLTVLKNLQHTVPGCFRILVTRFRGTVPESDDLEIHRFVSLRYQDTSPDAQLRSALLEGEEHLSPVLA
jgi:DNA-binding NtrC family response regulator